MSAVELESKSQSGRSFQRAEERGEVLLAVESEGGTSAREPLSWRAYEGGAYQVEIRVCSEESGGFSVYVANLPGVVSEGDTREEAERHLKEALLAAIEAYRESGEEIPWQHDHAAPQANEESRWIVVHA